MKIFPEKLPPTPLLRLKIGAYWSRVFLFQKWVPTTPPPNRLYRTNFGPKLKNLMNAVLCVGPTTMELPGGGRPMASERESSQIWSENLAKFGQRDRQSWPKWDHWKHEKNYINSLLKNKRFGQKDGIYIRYRLMKKCKIWIQGTLSKPRKYGPFSGWNPLENFVNWEILKTMRVAVIRFTDILSLRLDQGRGQRTCPQHKTRKNENKWPKRTKFMRKIARRSNHDGEKCCDRSWRGDKKNGIKIGTLSEGFTSRFLRPS